MLGCPPAHKLWKPIVGCIQERGVCTRAMVQEFVTFVNLLVLEQSLLLFGGCYVSSEITKWGSLMHYTFGGLSHFNRNRPDNPCTEWTNEKVAHLVKQIHETHLKTHADLGIHYLDVRIVLDDKLSLDHVFADTSTSSSSTAASAAAPT